MRTPPASTILPDSLIVRWLLVLLLIAAAYFFHSFLVPILVALIIGFASWSLYQRLVALCRGRTGIAAAIATVVITVGLVLPLTFALSVAVDEIRQWVEWLVEANRTGVTMPAWLGDLPGVGESLRAWWAEHIAEPGSVAYVLSLFGVQQIGNVSRWVLAFSGGALNFMLALVFMLITLFFIYKDGGKLVEQLDVVGERLLPGRWQRFSRVVPATVSATVMGMTLIAIGEGVVLGIAYWIAGVSSPFALGVLTAFMALVPGGAPLSFTLVSLYLLASGETGAALGLFAWGSMQLFIVDKTIRPHLVGGPIRLPFLPTFFGLVGGVKTMGIVGLFVGPVLMALLVAVWREWLHDPAGPEAIIDSA